MKAIRIGLLACLALSATLLQTHAAPGDVDASFDPGSTINSVVNVMTLQGEGKVLIGGRFTTIHGAMRGSLARLNADGSPDASFVANVSGHPVGYGQSVNAVCLQSDGKLIIGGAFTSVNGVVRSNLARLNTDGSLDTSFPGGSAGPNGPVGQVLLQNDGKILLAGSFTSPRPRLARLNPDGSFDNSFLYGLDGPDSGVYCLSLQSDGKLLIGGSFTSVSGAARTNLARLNADGSLDSSFLNGLSGPAGYGRVEVSGLCVQSDGRILIAGLFQSVHGILRTNLARLNSDGSLDTSFVGRVETCGHAGGAQTALIEQPDGKLLVGGSFCFVNGLARTNLVRLSTDGTVDESFLAMLPDLENIEGGLYSFCLQPDGKILVSGGIGYTTEIPGRYLCRLNSDGALDPTFNPGPTGPNATLHRLAPQPDGRIVVGGAFTSVSGLPRGHVARLMGDGSLDTTFLHGMSGADGDVNGLALQSDLRIIIAGEFKSVNA